MRRKNGNGSKTTTRGKKLKKGGTNPYKKKR